MLNLASNVLVGLPYVTQDNTHPVPIFKARLLRNKYDSIPIDIFSDSSRRDLPHGALFGAGALSDMEQVIEL